MAVSFEDDFVRVGNSDLDSHTPTIVGTRWDELINTTPPFNEAEVLNATGYVAPASADTNELMAYDAEPGHGSVEYNVEATINAVSAAGNEFGILGRLVGAGASNIDDAYGVRIASGGALNLVKIVAGVITVLAGPSGSVSATDVLRLEIRDVSKKVFVNDVEVMSHTDNVLTAAGQGGLFWGAVFQSIDDIGSDCRFDTFKVFDVDPVAQGGAQLLGFG